MINRTNNFQIFIDGLLSQEIYMPFPNLGDGLLSVAIGGFRGDLGQSFLYESSISEQTVEFFCHRFGFYRFWVVCD